MAGPEDRVTLTAAPPGPAEVVPNARIRADPLGFITAMHAEHGGFSRHRTEDREVYLANRPDLARVILRQDREVYAKTGTPDDAMLTPLLGKGLLTSEGEQWKRQRVLAQPAFERRRVLGFSDLMSSTALELVQRWAAPLADGREVRLDHELSGLTLTIVARAVLGAEIAGVGERFGASVDSVNRFMGHHGGDGDSPEEVHAREEFARARRFLDGLVALLVQGRRAGAGRGADDLLERLLAADPPFSARELRDQVLTMLMAGHETTAKALTWTVYLLDRHPDVGAALRAELRAELGDRVPTAGDLERLPLCRTVIQEAMRLYPPVWLISRRTTRPTELAGHPLPRGALVCVSPYVLHRDPALWDDPEAFDPARFSDARAEARHPFAYLPFSEGPRQCVGRAFALLEAQLVLATLWPRVEIALVPGHPVEPEALVTLRPRHGLLATLRPAA